MDTPAATPAGCDEPNCPDTALFGAHAASSHNPRADHPTYARYPMPMVRACAHHLGYLLSDDAGRPYSSSCWVVEVLR